MVVQAETGSKFEQINKFIEISAENITQDYYKRNGHFQRYVVSKSLA
jgi:hypothetical protein